MRQLLVLLAAVVLAGCSSQSRTEKEARSTIPAAVFSPAGTNESLDSVAQLLMTAAATDFRAHGPRHPLRFRDVRLGHVTGTNGELRYILCGDFTAVGGKEESVWTPFATIKTEPYEQWIGAQATTYCQESFLQWDTTGDLTSLLQTRCDSLR